MSTAEKTRRIRLGSRDYYGFPFSFFGNRGLSHPRGGEGYVFSEKCAAFLSLCDDEIDLSFATRSLHCVFAVEQGRAAGRRRKCDRVQCLVFARRWWPLFHVGPLLTCRRRVEVSLAETKGAAHTRRRASRLKIRSLARIVVLNTTRKVALLE